MLGWVALNTFQCWDELYSILFKLGRVVLNTFQIGKSYTCTLYFSILRRFVHVLNTFQYWEDLYSIQYNKMLGSAPNPAGMNMSASTGKPKAYSTKHHDYQSQDLFHACLGFARQLSQSKNCKLEVKLWDKFSRFKPRSPSNLLEKKEKSQRLLKRPEKKETPVKGMPTPCNHGAEFAAPGDPTE